MFHKYAKKHVDLVKLLLLNSYVTDYCHEGQRQLREAPDLVKNNNEMNEIKVKD